jgi:hypothetical protein
MSGDYHDLSPLHRPTHLTSMPCQPTFSKAVALTWVASMEAVAVAVKGMQTCKEQAWDNMGCDQGAGSS